jgi:hypothetical protein
MRTISTISAICLGLALGAVCQAQQAKPRHFRMGFTGFPHDFTAQAVANAHDFCKTNGDIIAHHIEGVPWAECLKDLPLSAEMTKEWEGKKLSLREGGATYLAISPGRGDLKVADKGLPLSKELVGKSYDDPLVEKAYLEYCRRAVGFFKPKYLAIGIEVNEIYQAGPDKWWAYVALHKYIYSELKRDHRDLPIFASFTLHGMLNLSGDRREKMLAAFREIMPANDVVAVSFYPFIRGGTTDIDGCFKWLTDHFDADHKPYAIVETGEPAERLELPKSKTVINGTPQKQTAYTKALLTFAASHRTEFVIWFIHRDYDALWEKIKGSSPEVFAAWKNCGTEDAAGHPRPAMDIWKQWFDMPFTAGNLSFP